jgi:hypothetical protein
MNKKEIDTLRIAYDKLVDDLETLLEGREVDAIIPALIAALGTVLVETGQDKTESIKFIVNGVITAYEMHADEEN